MIINFINRHIIMDVRKIVLRPNIGVFFYSVDGTAEKISQLEIQSAKKPIAIGDEAALRCCHSVSDLYNIIEMAYRKDMNKMLDLPF